MIFFLASCFILQFILTIQIFNQLSAYIAILLCVFRVWKFQAGWCPFFTTSHNFLLHRHLTKDWNSFIFGKFQDLVVVKMISRSTILTNNVAHIFNDSEDGNLQYFVHVSSSLGYFQGSVLRGADQNHSR